MTILRKFKVYNSTNISIIISIICFILTMVFTFLYFEPHDNIDLKYIPPKLIDGKIKSGRFN